MTNPAPPTKLAELYGLSTGATANWKSVSHRQQCPFLGRKCLKNRKSEPQLTIGTCTMLYGRQKVELQKVLDQIEAKLPKSSRLTVGGEDVPIPRQLDVETDED